MTGDTDSIALFCCELNNSLDSEYSLWGKGVLRCALDKLTPVLEFHINRCLAKGISKSSLSWKESVKSQKLRLVSGILKHLDINLFLHLKKFEM